MSSTQRLILLFYCVLMVFCTALIVLAAKLGPYVQESLTPIAVESLKVVLYTFIGALTALWGASK